MIATAYALFLGWHSQAQCMAPHGRVMMPFAHRCLLCQPSETRCPSKHCGTHGKVQSLGSVHQVLSVQIPGILSLQRNFLSALTAVRFCQLNVATSNTLKYFYVTILSLNEAWGHSQPSLFTFILITSWVELCINCVTFRQFIFLVILSVYAKSTKSFTYILNLHLAL